MFRYLNWCGAGWAIILASCVLAGAMPVAAGEVPDSKRLAQQLIDGARREGQLDWYVLNSMRSQGARTVAQAFNRRFGLNLQVNADVSGRTVEKFAEEIMKVRTGLPPSYDVMYGPDDRVVRLWQSGGLERTDNWEMLLKEISPEAYEEKDRVNPLALAGFAFVWGTRIKAINYNTALIGEAELPQTRVELGNPKYKGMYVLEPFTTTTEFGILVYPKERWLEIVRSWSAWSPPLMSNQAGIDRMLLGEFKFLPANAYHVFQIKEKNPKAPLGLAFFKDLTPQSCVFHAVRKGAKHPNAAKLFALWTTTSEANRIFENPEYGATPNEVLGTGPLSKLVSKVVKEKKIKVVSWFDNKEALEKLLWYGSEEGRRYGQELGRAQAGRK